MAFAFGTAPDTGRVVETGRVPVGGLEAAAVAGLEDLAAVVEGVSEEGSAFDLPLAVTGACWDDLLATEAGRVVGVVAGGADLAVWGFFTGEATVE